MFIYLSLISISNLLFKRSFTSKGIIDWSKLNYTVYQWSNFSWNMATHCLCRNGYKK